MLMGILMETNRIDLWARGHFRLWGSNFLKVLVE